GAELHRAGLQPGDRDDLREPLPARQRTGAPRRERPDRRQGGDGRGRATTLGRDRDGHRFARLRQPRDRRPGGRRRDPGGPHLPPGPRLRPDGSQAARHRRRHREAEMITLALSKGRIFDEILPLLRAAGIEVLDDPDKSRKLILSTSQKDLRVLVVRATDVPTYVQYGGADLGITGKDTLLEHGSLGLYQPLDLQIAKCRISVAVRDGFDYADAVQQGSRLKVATKYVAIARDFFAAKGVHVDLIKLYGSMELAPLTGLADAIVDIVSTGSTLRANQLVEVEKIMDVSSRLVVNQAALKQKGRALRDIIDAFGTAIPRS